LKRQFEGKSMARYREAKERFVTRVLDAAQQAVAADGGASSPLRR
jgi:hypothetical protein